MSKLVESLKLQLTSVFGDSFGQSISAIPLEEALAEARRPMPAKMQQQMKKMRHGGDPKKRLPSQGKYKEVKYSGSERKPAQKQSKLPPRGKYKDLKYSGPEKKAPAAVAPSSGGAAPKKAAGGGSSSMYNPFRRSPNLGTGPGTPPGFKGTGPRHHDEKKCWKCSCGHPVTSAGCKCVGTGATDDCPKGHVKKIKIKADYHQAYNDHYHAWRRKQAGAVTQRIAKQSRK